MSFRMKAIAVTRLIIVALLLTAIWAAPGTLANITASLGTLLWLFMPNVVTYEKKIFNYFKEKGNE